MATFPIELVFSGAPKMGMPVELVFGDDGGSAPAPDPVTLTSTAALPGLRGRIGMRVGVRIRSTARLPGLVGHVGTRYDINTARPLVAQTRTQWQAAQPVQGAALARHSSALPTSAGPRVRWQPARPLSQSVRTAWQRTAMLQRDLHTAWRQAQPLDTVQLHQRWQSAIARQSAVLARHSDALRAQSEPLISRWQDTWRDRQIGLTTGWQDAAGLFVGAANNLGSATALVLAMRLRHQDAWAPRSGTSRRPEPPVELPCYVPGLPVDLVFSDAATTGLPVQLLFSCNRAVVPPQAVIVVPIRRAYIVLNNITLHRVDTGVELSAHSFNMSLDYQSWTWSWSASLHHDAAAHLGRDSQGDPAELAVVVNGVNFRLRLGRKVRDRRFNPTRWSVSGSGKAAILGAPYAPSMSFGNSAPRTAQQLMNDVLTINGVSNGWSVDWGLTDWLVPAGAWALQGSYIDAINDIASAAGGYVQPHPIDAVLRILPRYPVAPWNWGSVTPDFEIPADAAEVEGTEYVDRPAYNRVFVGGVGAGVFGPFTRAGTAGNTIAPQVTHPLITHADAHRQRGLAEISDTGRQEHIKLNMQVLPETGVITPGQFVRYLGDKTVMGIVRSTSIDWSRPRLRQTIGIETHA